MTPRRKGTNSTFALIHFRRPSSVAMIASDRRSPSLRPAPRVPKLLCLIAETVSNRTYCATVTAASACSTSSLGAGIGATGGRLLIDDLPSPHPPAYQVHAPSRPFADAPTGKYSSG